MVILPSTFRSVIEFQSKLFSARLENSLQRSNVTAAAVARKEALDSFGREIEREEEEEREIRFRKERKGVKGEAVLLSHRIPISEG